MTKIHTILFLLLSIIITGIAYADVTTDCMQRISNNSDFQNTLKNTVFDGRQELTDEIVQAAKTKILGTVAATMLVECPTDISVLAKQANGKIWTTINNQLYGIVFSMADLFAYTNIRLGILVSNNRSLATSDVVESSSIKNIYWSDECSDHIIWDNLDDDAAINIAGQSVFSQYGGNKNEFFLDFEKGNNSRAFPGLVLMDETGSSSESIVTFSDLSVAITAAQQFANKLQNSACSLDNLAVYVVSLDVKRMESNGKQFWSYTAGIVGGATIIAGGLAIAGTAGTAVAATGSMLLLNAAIGASAIPVWGWIAAGALATTAGIIALVPGKIEEIQRVMVMDGPYLIK